jgi:DNA-binding response OmpR family regulator
MRNADWVAMDNGQGELRKSGTWSRWAMRGKGLRRIVVAEDDREMRRLVAAALTKDGYLVEEAPDGPRLLVRVIEADPPVDLVISDHRMPVSSGLQVLAGLRDAGWTIPFILVSAFGDKTLRSEAEKLNAIFLDKPFELDVLRVIVHAALARP